MQKANFAFLFSGGLKKKADPLINFPLLTKSVTWDTVWYVLDVRLQILIPTDDSGKAWLVVSRSNVPEEPQCLTLIQTKG